MSQFVYPSKRFIKNMLRSINRGEEFQIIVQAGRRQNAIIDLLPSVIDKHSKTPMNRSWRSMWYMLKAISFWTAYFYGESGGYVMSYEQVDERLTINFRPPSSLG